MTIYEGLRGRDGVTRYAALVLQGAQATVTPSQTRKTAFCTPPEGGSCGGP